MTDMYAVPCKAIEPKCTQTGVVGDLPVIKTKLLIILIHTHPLSLAGTRSKLNEVQKELSKETSMITCTGVVMC